MQAAEDAARFQAALGLEHLKVIGSTQAQNRTGSIVLVLDSKTNIITDGRVQMYIVPGEEAPASMLAALERCSRSKVIVWEKQRALFHDLADRTLYELSNGDVDALYGFLIKLRNNVQGTTMLRGTWCALRIAEGSVETISYTHILGTVVLSNAVEHVLVQLKRALIAEASPLVDPASRVHGRKRARFTVTTLAEDLV